MIYELKSRREGWIGTLGWTCGFRSIGSSLGLSVWRPGFGTGSLLVGVGRCRPLKESCSNPYWLVYSSPQSPSPPSSNLNKLCSVQKPSLHFCGWSILNSGPLVTWVHWHSSPVSCGLQSFWQCVVIAGGSACWQSLSSGSCCEGSLSHRSGLKLSSLKMNVSRYLLSSDASRWKGAWPAAPERRYLVDHWCCKRCFNCSSWSCLHLSLASTLH